MSAPARPYAAPRNSTPGAIPTSTSAATATTSPSLPSTAPRHLCPPSRSNSLSVATPSRLKSSSAAHRPSQRQPRWTSASPAPWPKPAHPSPSPTCAPSAASAMQRCTHASPPSPPTAASRARTTATASPAVEHFPLPLPASPTARGKSEREFLRQARSPRHQKACSRSVTANPSAEWTARQVVQAFPEETAPRYLVRDRDQIYGGRFRRMLEILGVEEVV